MFVNVSYVSYQKKIPEFILPNNLLLFNSLTDQTLFFRQIRLIDNDFSNLVQLVHKLNMHFVD